MKRELLDTTPASQRRRWLGAVSAVAAGLVAWSWRGRAPRAALSADKANQPTHPAASAGDSSASVRLVVKPSPYSVKRHG
jgi:hypothetical protein